MLTSMKAAVLKAERDERERVRASRSRAAAWRSPSPAHYACEVIVTRQGGGEREPRPYRGNWTPSMVPRRAPRQGRQVDVELVRVLSRDEYLELLPD